MACYANYSLIELITLLDARKIPITCPLNKRCIIQMIHDKKIAIPMVKTIKKSEWHYEQVRYGDIVICVHGCEKPTVDFLDGDTIRMENGEEYFILLQEYRHDDDKKYDTAIVLLTNTKTKEMIEIGGDEFVEMLDNKDITIVLNHSRVYRGLMKK